MRTRSARAVLFFAAATVLPAVAASEVFPPKAFQAPPEMVKKWETGCREDRSNDCFNLGVYEAQDVGDEAKALPLYERACKLGSGLACFNAGGLLIKMDGRREDGARAFDSACAFTRDLEQPASERHAIANACGFAKIVRAHPRAKYSELVRLLSRSSSR